MSVLTFSEAADILLKTAGLDIRIGAAEQQDDLPVVLQGSGLSARRVPLINNIFPASDDLFGLLFEKEGRGWVAVSGSGLDAFLLGDDGSKERPLEPVDMAGVTHVWLIERNADGMGNMASFITKHKKRFIEIFTCGFIVNLFALCLPLFSSFVYDKIIGNGITETLWGLVIGLMIVVVVEFCIRMMRVEVAERFAISSEADIDHSTFRNLLDAKANALPNIGELLEKYKQILSYRDFMSSSYLLALADLPFLLLFLFTILLVSGPLVLVALLCGIALVVSGIVFTLPVFDYDRQARRASERRLGLITDVLMAHEAVIGGALRSELSRRWRQTSMAAITASSLSRYWRSLGMTFSGTISYISYIGVLVGGVYMIEARDLSSGGLLAASMLTSRTMGGFSSVLLLVIRYREFKTALRELDQILPSMKRVNLQKIHGRMQGSIRLEKVTCRMRKEDMPVLSEISININPGELVCIAGAPGAGKTTLLRLIAGTLAPDSGRVLIDNMPIENISPDDLSQNIGLKPQDFCLIEGSIEDSVRAGRAPMTAEAKQQILISSGLIRCFQENGLNWTTPIGNRGSALSGGQRQLVSLARAMYDVPALLLLDEPTNGLDAALEKHLGEEILRLKGKSTIIISSHSRNLLTICDRIIVVGQSKILADGPRDKILA